MKTVVHTMNEAEGPSKKKKQCSSYDNKHKSQHK